MNKLDLELKNKIARLLGIIGGLTSIFIPFIGIIFFLIIIGLTYKKENIDLYHSFIFGIVGATASLVVFIVTLIQLY